MRRLLIIVFFFIMSLTFARPSQAVEFEPYIKYGTIDASEKDHKKATAHKAMLGTGVNITLGEKKKLKQIFGAEPWTMAEPVDSDREVPHNGIALSGKFSYQFAPYSNTLIYPYAGLGFEQWSRNSSASEEFYGHLWFADALFGFGLNHKNLYFEAGGLLPFWSDTDRGHQLSGRLGLTLNAGLLYKKIKFGLFYSQKSFGGDGGQTDFQLEQYGPSAGYKF